ncbi:MAG TPA: SAM-dependent chlorinase/fluorinase [Terriglobia bacterium]|nr:SAM-dependent chlorinase/fluorinase [Terriglobia bacterium]
MAQQPIVTLTTDFGLSDHFVGTMKGVMLNINPLLQFVDISHAIASHDIFDGAFTIGLSYRYFPPHTIHLVIVDPGVGSSRRAVVASAGQHLFVAPDNGVLSLIYEHEAHVEVRHVTADHYFLKPVSNTFHGRDIFAPVAAWLSKGIELNKLGEPVTDYVKFTSPRPKRLDGGRVQGTVIKVDKFGNLITNLSPAEVPELFSANPPAFRLAINQQEISRLYTSYSEGKPSEIFAILGSSGFIEVGQNRASASRSLQAGRGTEVIVSVG